MQGWLWQICAVSCDILTVNFVHDTSLLIFHPLCLGAGGGGEVRKLYASVQSLAGESYYHLDVGHRQNSYTNVKMAFKQICH